MNKNAPASALVAFTQARVIRRDMVDQTAVVAKLISEHEPVSVSLSFSIGISKSEFVGISVTVSFWFS